jgi:autotransporter passenger strand-loop-strand repeat protein
VAGGSAIGVIVDSGGGEFVYSAGIASATVVSGGGSVTVMSSGVTEGDTIGSGGLEVVLSGGSANGLAVGSGGFAMVSAGGTVSGATIDNGGTLIVFPGADDPGLNALAGSLVITAGVVVVSAGALISATTGTASGFTVITGQTEYVFPGGTADFSFISGGHEIVTSGGVVSGGVLTAGREIVSGGLATGEFADGGFYYVTAGGSANSLTVNENGVAVVWSGGEVTSAVLSMGGGMIVRSGGNIDFTVVSNGGFLNVTGGTVTSTTLLPDGHESVAGGTVDTGTLVDDGFFIVDVGGIASGTILRGGITTVPVVGEIFAPAESVYGIAVAPVISGGSLFIGDGGVASGAVISTSGSELVLSGGQDIGTILDGGSEALGFFGNDVETDFDVLSAGGNATSTMINDRGVLIVYDTTSAVDTTVNSGGYQVVSSGGLATGGTVTSSGFEIIVSGGLASGVTVQSGGIQIVFPGGHASGTNAEPGSVIVSSGVVLEPTGDDGFIGEPIAAWSATVTGDVVGSGLREVILPGGLAVSSLILSGGEELVSSGGTADFATVSNGGTAYVQPSGLAFGAVLASGGFENVSSGGTAISTVVNNGGFLGLSGGTAIETELFPGGTIGVYNVVFSGGQPVLSGGTLTATEGGTTISLTLSGNYGSDVFSASTYLIDGFFADGTQITVSGSTLPCFAAGSRIATVGGEVAVEDLRVGDVVTLHDGRHAPVVWIGRRHVGCARHPMPEQMWPVRVAADAFGPGMPHRDLLLSPDHAIFAAGVLIPVKHLITGSSIARVAMSEVTYFHVELPAHDVLLAEGLPVESYLDTGDRANFSNFEGPVRLFPDFSMHVWEANGYAPPRVAGPEVEAVRRLLRDRMAGEVCEVVARAG